MNAFLNNLRRGSATRLLLLSMMGSAMITGCSTPNGSDAKPPTDTMTMAEMRLDAAGGPSKAAIPAGLASPAAAPGPIAPGALTDAGLNTALGKEWIFTGIDGYTGAIPGPPTDASFVMSRGNGRLIGTTSCNPMGAAFAIDMVAATLKFWSINNGQAMCGEPNADVEVAVVARKEADPGPLPQKKREPRSGRGRMEGRRVLERDPRRLTGKAVEAGGSDEFAIGFSRVIAPGNGPELQRKRPAQIPGIARIDHAFRAENHLIVLDDAVADDALHAQCQEAFARRSVGEVLDAVEAQGLAR